jgi:sugar phosphate isomerase/epimerase
MVERFREGYNNGMENDFSMHFGSLSWSTNPQTANQLGELGMRLNEGVKNVEIGALSQDVFGAIPTQHMEEMRRMAKLTDSKLSLHAPVQVDPAGFSQQGWNEHQRKLAEQEFKDVIERAYELDPDGNIPVNFHASGGGLPAVIWDKKAENLTQKEIDDAKKKGIDLLNPKQMMTVVNTQTGQMQHLVHEEVEWLSGNEVLDVDRRLRTLNESSWEQQKMSFLSMMKQKEETEVLQRNWKTNSEEGRRMMALELKYMQTGGRLNQDEVDEFGALKKVDERYEEQKKQYNQYLFSHLNDVYSTYKKGFNPIGKTEKEVHEYEEKEIELKNLTNNFQKQNQIEIDYLGKDGTINKWIKSNKDKLSREEVSREVNEMQKEMEAKIKSEVGGPRITPETVSNSLIDLQTPEIFRPMDDVAQEKAAETFANVAFHAYKKFEDKMPLIAVENVYPEWTLSRAESLKGMIENAKKQFAEKLVKDKGFSEDHAKKVAEKNMGVTWDVGHINQLRKYGYSEEEVVEEAKKIGKHVKHLHLTDNFGYGDTHLAPGMGNVPIRRQVEEIEKQLGGEYKGKAVVEAGGMINQFKMSPVPYSVEGLNSPFYSYDKGPSWTDVRGVYSSYLFGFGDTLPDQHFKMQGGGFSMLPMELGGQSAGDKGRFANQ